MCFPSSDLRHHDLTGRFSVTGFAGTQYLMVMICGNYIHIEPVNTRGQADYVKAYARGADFFEERGITPSFERMDNEASDLLVQYCKAHVPPIALQHVPANNHRGNKAERAIRTTKNHLVAMLSLTDPSFPIYLFDKLLEQAELTLNLLRGSSFSPHVSAWQALNGAYKFSNTPIAPPGMKIVCFESPEQRPSWAPHGVDGFYIGPAFGHHRCYKVYISSTKGIRTTGQLSWHPPAGYTLPGASPLDDLVSCLTALKVSCDTLTHTHPDIVALPQANLPSVSNLSAALDILASLLHPPSSPCLPKPLAVEEPGGSQRVPLHNTRSHDAHHTASASQRVAPADPAPSSAPASPQRVATPAPPAVPPTSRRRHGHGALPEPDNAGTAASASVSANSVPPPSPSLNPAPFLPAYGRGKKSRDKKFDYHRASFVDPKYPSLYEGEGLAGDSEFLHRVASVLQSNLYLTDANRKKLKIRGTRHQWDAKLWRAEESKEILRLIKTTGTMNWMDYKKKPKDRLASYYNPQCSLKKGEGGELIRRVRGTYGGNVSDYAGNRSSWTADMQTIKLLLNAVVSENADFCTADIGDFYLGSQLEQEEYMWLTKAQIPEDIIEEYGEHMTWLGDKTMVRIVKGIYGLPQAGRLAHEKLCRLLKRHDYHACPNTPCLFVHATNGVKFTLVVDDFAIKYGNRPGVEHLFAAIREEYRLEVDWQGSKYIGMSIEYNKKERWLRLSMPGYVEAALARFGVVRSGKPTHNPTKFDPIVYGQRIQLADADDSPLCTEAEATFIREVVGVFLYYARAIDITMATPLSKLSIGQAKPTTRNLAAVMYFLQYAATYPDATLTYYPSDMRLVIWSDASYLSESNARSRAGGMHYLTSQGDPIAAKPNGAVEVISSIIPTVCSASSEAETAGLFINGQAGVPTRLTLTDLGYPQPATPIISDNTTAIGFANNSVRLKRSKAIDMRYHWIRDRVARGEYSVAWGPGAENFADYFTKNHPAKHCREIRSRYVGDKSLAS